MYNEGDVLRIKFPFLREWYDFYDEDGPCKGKTWNPGVRRELVDPGDAVTIADGEGEMVLEVVGVFKPGRFPTRVFYTRHFIDPDGNKFGKSKCHIATLGSFHKRAKGYAVPYIIEHSKNKDL